jgi:hypothetical protein
LWKTTQMTLGLGFDGPVVVSTINREQFRLTEHCLFSAILAPPLCSLRGLVGDSKQSFIVTHTYPGDSMGEIKSS